MNPIDEVFLKYKHFDELLSDENWMSPWDGESDVPVLNSILYDLWKAIKEYKEGKSE